ncbi:MAG: hypothetical protein LBC07_01775 [Elusimicrobiota bacterium]|nr:hypothetical protein [Elusimicrobiota bacterium]
MTDNSLYCHARLGEGKGNFQFPLPSWRKKFLVKTKRFAAFARLKNKKSAGESTTRQKQHKKFLVCNAYAPLRRKTKRAREIVRYDNDKNKDNSKQQRQNNKKILAYNAYAPLRRKTKRAREIVRHDNDKNKDNSKQQRQNNKKNFS